MEPEHDCCGAADGRHERAGATVVTSVDAAPIFEFAEHVLDLLMLAIEVRIVRDGRFPLPNILTVVENLMEATTPPMRKGRRTILAILKKLPASERALANPQEFAAAMVTAIKTRLADQLVDGIQYERDGTRYEQRQFDDLAAFCNLPSLRGRTSCSNPRIDSAPGRRDTRIHSTADTYQSRFGAHE